MSEHGLRDAGRTSVRLSAKRMEEHQRQNCTGFGCSPQLTQVSPCRDEEANVIAFVQHGPLVRSDHSVSRWTQWIPSGQVGHTNTARCGSHCQVECCRGNDLRVEVQLPWKRCEVFIERKLRRPFCVFLSDSLGARAKAAKRIKPSMLQISMRFFA